jgi:hypothetical protein
MTITEQTFMKMTLRASLLKKKLYTGFHGHLVSELFANTFSETDRRILSLSEMFLFCRELIKIGLYLAKSSAKIIYHKIICHFHNSFDDPNYKHATTSRDCT